MSEQLESSTSNSNSRFIALVASIALPFLLLLVGFAIEWYNRSAIPDPFYDAVFALQSAHTGSTGCSNVGVQPSYVSGSLPPQIKFQYFNSSTCYSLPRFFRYRSDQKVIEEIEISPQIWPESGMTSTTVVVPELRGLNLVPEEAPDGYRFEIGSHRSQPTFLFFQPNYQRQKLSIYNAGKRIELPDAPDPQYYGGTSFVGWIVGEGAGYYVPYGDSE